MTTLIPSFTAVIAALNISLGADVGGFFLETVAKELKAEVCIFGRGCTGALRALLAVQSNRSSRRPQGGILLSATTFTAVDWLALDASRRPLL